ncbi:MAG: ATP-binding protein [Saccharofermentanales bacterium]
MELKRKIYDKLLDWKQTNKGSTAMMIEGARRVGKSYISKLFGEREYKSYKLIDFSNVSSEIKDLFLNEAYDLDIFFLKLSVYYNVQFYVRDTLIIFDEVQLFPVARQLIKHLVADGRFDYLETGSLITLKRNIQEIVIPSEEEHIEMFPMDFEEFLIAIGESMTFEYMRNHYNEEKALGDAIHRKVMNLFRQYILTGGMPQAVLEFIETKDFARVDKIKRRILKLYRDDVSKFAKGYESKVLAIFDEIPDQLSKHEKRFTMSALDKAARFREYEDSFIWLSEAKIINVCFNATDPNVGLAMNQDRLTLKCYMADTGLLISHSFGEGNTTDNEIYKALLFDKISINEGMIMENVVAQMLKSSGHKLYFYSRSDKNNSQNTLEIDFLIRKNKKISPIEVKSSGYNKHTSIDKFNNKFKSRIGQTYIIYTKDFKKEENITYLPIYMTIFL